MPLFNNNSNSFMVKGTSYKDLLIGTYNHLARASFVPCCSSCNYFVIFSHKPQYKKLL